MESKPIVIITVPPTDLVVLEWNPRKFMEEGPLQELADYIGKGGLVDRILVWKGNGQAPWAVISGQRRLAAYRRLGWERVEVEVLDITLTEAKIMANTSNDVVPPFWLDRYEGWESLMKEEFWDQPTLTSKLGKSLSQTSRAIRTLRTLNARSRQMIRETLPKPGAGGSQKGPKSIPPFSPGEPVHDFRPISEGEGMDPEDSPATGFFTAKQALPLTAFLSANPKEDEGDLKAQAQAEKALPVMIARGMSQAQVKSLVEGVKGGQQPEAFNNKKAVEPPRASVPKPQAEARGLSVPIPGNVGIGAPRASRTAKTQEIGLNPSTSSGQATSTQSNLAQTSKTQKPREGEISKTEVASSSAAPYSGATPRAVGQPQVGQPSAEAEAASANDSNQSQHAGFKLLGQTLGSLFHWVWHNPLPFLKSIAGWGKKTAAQSLEKAFKQSVRREERRLFKWALWCVVLGAVWVFFHGSPIHRTAWLPQMELPRIQTNSSMNSEQASSTNSPQTGSTSAAKANSSASTQAANSPSAASAGSPQATSTSSGRASNKMANSPSELAQPNPSMNSGQANKTGSQQGASTHVDPFAKAVGDAAGEAAKKALNLPF